jgi:rod shape-determining protein MreC
VGRVVGVTDDVSRVLMLTDVASRVPVMVDRTNARAILTGDGGPNPKMEYLRGRDPVKVGDLVATSGDGGVVPRGLPVGVAVKDVTGKWRVALAADNNSIDFVQILKFVDFAQLADRRELSAVHVPPVTTEDPRTSILGAAAAQRGPAPAPAATASASAPSTTTAAPAAPKPAASAATAPRPPTSPAPRPPAAPAPAQPQPQPQARP